MCVNFVREHETGENTALKVSDVQINLDGPAVAFDCGIPERLQRSALC